MSFILFAMADLLLMATTAVTGLLVMGSAGYTRHFLLGVLTAMFTCFVHIVLFMYFVVQQKIMAQAVVNDGLDPSFAHRAQECKSRALKLSAVGMLSVVLTSLLGATIESGVSPSVHLIAAFSTMFANACLFYFQFALLDAYRTVFQAAFDE
ncbi:MAG: hypothetical protein H6818_13840 [Phycisphaerales bacterium]|nr:hypothetical protein [Phycisphaerales bacterium]MCB9862116.1 hypothetical protein [Phycisphaerales bacterium]